MKLKEKKLFLNINEYIIILFILSLFHPIFGFIFYIGSLKLIQKEKVIGAIKYMIIVTMRDLLSSAVGASLGNLNTLKLCIILVISLYILKLTFYNIKSQGIKLILFFTMLFCVYVTLTSFISGSYPIVSIFKVWIFGLNFVAIIYGIYYTRKKIDWLYYIFYVLTPFFVISFFIIPFGKFRIVNDNFQGVFNHVNLMGIMGTLYISVLLNIKKNKMDIYTILIVLILYMQYLTASRTGMFVSIFIIFVHFLININVKKAICFLMIITIAFSFYYYNSTIKNIVNTEIHEYIYKNNTNDILSSRRELQQNFQEKYQNNPLIGSGFMVPFDQAVQDYSFDMSIIYEPGNLFWELIGGVGIIGFVLFILLIILILCRGNLDRISLILSSIGVCLGEMVFFSVNNMAVLLYVFIAIFLIKPYTRRIIDEK